MRSCSETHMKRRANKQKLKPQTLVVKFLFVGLKMCIVKWYIYFLWMIKSQFYLKAFERETSQTEVPMITWRDVCSRSHFLSQMFRLTKSFGTGSLWFTLKKVCFKTKELQELPTPPSFSLSSRKKLQTLQGLLDLTETEIKTVLQHRLNFPVI